LKRSDILRSQPFCRKGTGNGFDGDFGGRHDDLAAESYAFIFAICGSTTEINSHSQPGAIYEARK
jgi:hypothetical protein